jgi:hypothetical protein
VALLFLLSESETFSVSTNTPNALLRQRDRSEATGLDRADATRGIGRAKNRESNTARFRGFHLKAEFVAPAAAWSGYGYKPVARLARSESLLMTRFRTTKAA